MLEKRKLKLHISMMKMVIQKKKLKLFIYNKDAGKYNYALIRMLIIIYSIYWRIINFIYIINYLK